MACFDFLLRLVVLFCVQEVLCSSTSCTHSAFYARLAAYCAQAPLDHEHTARIETHGAA